MTSFIADEGLSLLKIRHSIWMPSYELRTQLDFLQSLLYNTGSLSYQNHHISVISELPCHQLQKHLKLH